jgi:hypothetical protein
VKAANTYGMRITFEVSGGIGYFPNRAAPHTIDVDQLIPIERDAVLRLVRIAGVFEHPPAAGVGGSADHRVYRITVVDEGRKHTIDVADPVTEPPFRDLIATLRSLTARQRP